MSSHAASPSPDVPAAFPAVTGEHWIETLADGRRVLIRPLKAEDRLREQAFIRRLSAESRRCRFLGEIREASESVIDDLMDVDGVHSLAFIALAHDDGELREVGVSRYSATNEPRRCECAVTVADDWRHQGLAAILMRHLIAVARRNGFQHMFSIDLAEDRGMEELARELGFSRALDPEDPTLVVHTLTL